MPATPSTLEAAVALAGRAGEWLRLGLDAIGLLVIAIGAVVTVTRVARRIGRGATEFESERLRLARFLAWALEFQLASDVVNTAIAPDWTKIGQVAATAAVRIGLNVALRREIAEERRAAGAGEGSRAGAGART